MQRGHRLRHRADFRHVVRHGRRVARREFVLHYVPGDERTPPRVGFSVSRRIGGAVVRNRIRRLLRESTRRILPRLRPCDLVVSARPEIVNLGSHELESALADAAARAGLILSDP